MEPRARFGENLRAERKRRELSQMELGRIAGLHFSEVSLLERGSRDPRLATIVKLARALQIPPAKLLDGID